MPLRISMQWDMDGRVYYGHRVVLLVYSKAPFMLLGWQKSGMSNSCAAA
jgi:hypothetical protein